MFRWALSLWADACAEDFAYGFQVVSDQFSENKEVVDLYSLKADFSNDDPDALVASMNKNLENSEDAIQEPWQLIDIGIENEKVLRQWLGAIEINELRKFANAILKVTDSYIENDHLYED